MLILICVSSLSGYILVKTGFGEKVVFRELKKTLMRNPLKEKRRFRAASKAFLSAAGTDDIVANVLSPDASPKNDYLELSG